MATVANETEMPVVALSAEIEDTTLPLLQKDTEPKGKTSGKERLARQVTLHLLRAANSPYAISREKRIILGILLGLSIGAALAAGLLGLDWPAAVIAVLRHYFDTLRVTRSKLLRASTCYNLGVYDLLPRLYG